MTLTPELITALSAAFVATISAIISFRQNSKTLKRDALDQANAQIARLDEQIKRLEKKIDEKNNKIDTLEERITTLEAERLTLKLTLDIAFAYIERLRSIMIECNIAVPPMPKEIETKR